MATYTWEELKDYASVSAVANWSEDKCLLYQQMAESILAGLALDTSMTGYAAAYNGAVIQLFDFLAENPTGLSSSSKGKVSKTFSASDMPVGVQLILQPFIEGSEGTLTGTQFVRRDVGLR